MNNLFEKVVSFENIYLAYKKAKKCKGYKKYVLKFNKNLENNLLSIKRDLISGKYKHGKYKKFIVNDSKKREIKAAPFRDRIIHHAVCNVIEPVFDTGFIFDSYACRKHKGTHRAVKRLKNFLKSSRRVFKEPKIYCLKCDISKYFASINHEILLELIKAKISDEKLIGIIEEIINSSYDSLEYENLLSTRKRGIPIGNLTSQLFANIYLNELDQFIKHQLSQEFKKQKISPTRYYIRYMDDFLFLYNDKKILHEIKVKLKSFIFEELRLTLHPKKASIFFINKGVEFLGYVIRYPIIVKLRKSTVRRFIKRIKKYRKVGVGSDEIARAFISFEGFAKHGKSFWLMQKIWESYGLVEN